VVSNPPKRRVTYVYMGESVCIESVYIESVCIESVCIESMCIESVCISVSQSCGENGFGSGTRVW
jgi:hypothetical protein